MSFQYSMKLFTTRSISKNSRAVENVLVGKREESSSRAHIAGVRVLRLEDGLLWSSTRDQDTKNKQET